MASQLQQHSAVAELLNLQLFSPRICAHTVCNINMGVVSRLIQTRSCISADISFFLTLSVHDAILVFVNQSDDRRKIKHVDATGRAS